MKIESIAKDLSSYLSQYRLKHSVYVMHTAKKLAYKYGVDPYKAEITGLLHDCGKYMSDQVIIAKAKSYNIKIKNVQYYEPDLLHGPVGAMMAKEKYPNIDEEMYNAIYYHTTGRPEMNELEKIIYVADLIEPTRNYPEVDELRSYVGLDLDVLTLKVMDKVLLSLIKSGKYIDPLTIKARNKLYNNVYSRE
jgi:predicted HD superfamily hydrolase involved in NAD metabolism